MSKYALYKDGARVSEVRTDENIPGVDSIVTLDGTAYRVIGCQEVRRPGDGGLMVVDHWGVNIERADKPKPAPIELTSEARAIKEELRL
jgi:hypothetical protein